MRRKVVNGEVVFDLDGQTVAFTLSGVVGTTALGSETVSPVSNATFTPVIVDGVSSTGELGTSDQQVATIPGVGAVGTVIVATTVVPLSTSVSDFVDEG